MHNLGIDIDGRELKLDDIISTTVVKAHSEQDFKTKLRNAGFDSSKKNLVMFINQNKTMRNSKAFDHFKRVVEQVYGFHSLCVTQSAYSRSKQPEQFMANVAMKVSIRLGNANHIFAPGIGSSTTSLQRLVNGKGLFDTMILGADVTHTQKDGAAGSHSLAALVGSVDETFGRFYRSMRYQEKNKEVRHIVSYFINPLTFADHRRCVRNDLTAARSFLPAQRFQDKNCKATSTLQTAVLP